MLKERQKGREDEKEDVSRYWKLKEEVLDRGRLGTGIGNGYAPVQDGLGDV
jgi:hypothetical protein